MKVKTKGKEYDVAEPVGQAIKDMKDKIDNLEAKAMKNKDQDVLIEEDQDEEILLGDQDPDLLAEDQDEELLLGDQDPLMEEDQDEELLLGDMGSEHEKDQDEEILLGDQDPFMEEDQDELVALEDELDQENFQNKMEDHMDTMDTARRVLSPSQLKRVKRMRSDDIKRIVVIANYPNVNRDRLDSKDYLNV